MAKIDSAFFDINSLEVFARQGTPIHTIDPRAKAVTTFFFIITVVSFDKYEISGLLPFLVYPVLLAVIGNIPSDYLIKKIILVAPFAFFIGILNPFFDRAPMLDLGFMTISGGWISFLSILLRFILTVSAALILIATSGFREVCLALEKLKSPRIFSIQLLFLYRYLFVLINEARRLIRARQLRSFNGRGMGLTVAGSMIGHLLVRTLNRARRIHLAMMCRGFDGEIRILRTLRFTMRDACFILGWILIFLFLRFNNLPRMMGTLFTGHFS
ncbi:MAG: cobalt ECF transporter T component CbiQ [Proteobacteria bacterium]|nr:cobalt ECF transporter T component CbiQ [Pseudomonadota bacterium]MBU1710685.1 cobalt ECF transporter T component CbiQ [Pseudomonadota bacterium]